MFRRFIVAISVTFGVAVLGTATPAFAHHTTTQTSGNAGRSVRTYPNESYRSVTEFGGNSNRVVLYNPNGSYAGVYYNGVCFAYC